MRKLLSLLLILLVFTGVLFAEELPGTATLNLATIVAEQVYHGFFSSLESISFDEDQAVNNTVSGVAPNASNVDFGYYALYINLPTQVKVGFTLNSLTTTAGDDLWYVPYKLSVSQAGQDGVRFGESFFTAKTFGSDSTPTVGGNDPLASLGGDVLTTSGSGNGYIALKLTASFNSGNLELIPSGSYSGSIVASITTP